MASSGQAAWTKYFQGKGDIQTVMKKDSPVYDQESANKKIGDIKAGTSITYIASKKYEAKALVKYVDKRKTITGRVVFDNIAKPGIKASGAASLKPQAFNVGDQKYVYSVYRKTVMDSIESRKDLSGEMRSYLFALFDYYSGGKTTKQQIAKIFAGVKNSIPLNDINKDFGEVLGPVAILEENLLSRYKITIAKGSTKIFVPSRPNEPLMDYALYVGEKQYTISAKSGTTTNVVKPPDIIALLSKNAKTLKKWEKTKQFQVLSILSQESIITGPIKAVAVLYPNLLSQAAANSVTKQNYDAKLFAKFISNNEYLKNKKNPTVTEIMYECEKILQQDTKNKKLDMTDIFSDAIENQVLYVKFQINSTGIGDWDAIASSDIRKANSNVSVYLRTKNGYTRASDRMGIQV
jgi:hypothetical protein